MDTNNVDTVTWEIDHWWGGLHPCSLLVAMDSKGYKVLRSDSPEGTPLGVFSSRKEAESFARASRDVTRLLNLVKELSAAQSIHT